MRRILVVLVSILILVQCDAEKKIVHELDKVASNLLPDSVDKYQDYINQNYQVFAIPLPRHLTFAGERVPLDNLFVRENLDKEILVNTYWHSNTFLYQKRAARWFPLIEKILKENKMPEDLKYLALIESGLDNVESPAGAAGFWQFLASTGQGYGLEINEFVDERYNLEKATKAACDYLKVAHKQFGSWSLAAASYNMGKGGLNNQLTKQKVDSYYELYLNRETSRYVYRILAAKLILSNSENFGFTLRNRDYYKPYSTYTIKVDTTINDLVKFSLDQGSNYATMRHLNPWIRNYQIPNPEGKTYMIKFPKGDFHIEEITETADTNTEDGEITELLDSMPIKKTDTSNLLRKTDNIKNQTK